LPAAALVAAVLAATTAAAGLVRDDAALPAPDARAVFELVKQAFEAEDQQVLADLVHEDGLRVHSGTGGRDTEYSPSQAFYYFKNLFQSHRTVSFTYLRMEEAAAGERVHAMAQWTHRAPDSGESRDTRLVFVLSRQGKTWRLTELTTIG